MNLEERLARGEFRASQQRAIRRLKTLLPSEERGGIESDVSYWSLEAIRLYRPELGAAFPTFLHAHLHNRARACVLKAWAKRRRPRMGFVEFTDHAAHDPPAAEIAELRDRVSAPTREVLDLALGSNSVTLRDAFCSRYYQHRVGQLLDVPRQQVRQAVLELQREIPKTISSVSAT